MDSVMPPHGGWTPSPNFVVKLRHGLRAIRWDDVAAFLDFWQWNDAHDTVVWFWESCLSGGHDFTLELISNVLVPPTPLREPRDGVNGREGGEVVGERERAFTENEEAEGSLPLSVTSRVLYMLGDITAGPAFMFTLWL